MHLVSTLGGVNDRLLVDYREPRGQETFFIFLTKHNPGVKSALRSLACSFCSGRLSKAIALTKVTILWCAQQGNY